jgi:hypothetical protein
MEAARARRFRRTRCTGLAGIGRGRYRTARDDPERSVPGRAWKSWTTALRHVAKEREHRAGLARRLGSCLRLPRHRQPGVVSHGRLSGPRFGGLRSVSAGQSSDARRSRCPAQTETGIWLSMRATPTTNTAAPAVECGRNVAMTRGAMPAKMSHGRRKKAASLSCRRVMPQRLGLGADVPLISG